MKIIFARIFGRVTLLSLLEHEHSHQLKDFLKFHTTALVILKFRSALR